MYCLWFGSLRYVVVDAIKFRMINLIVISILFVRRHRLNGLNETKKKNKRRRMWRRFGLDFGLRFFYKRCVRRLKSLDLYNFGARVWSFSQ